MNARNNIGEFLLSTGYASRFCSIHRMGERSAAWGRHLLTSKVAARGAPGCDCSPGSPHNGEWDTDLTLP